MTAKPQMHTGNRRGQPRSRYMIDCGPARVQVRALRLATVLRLDGQIDASNADVVAEAIRRFSKLMAPLIIDTSRLEFLGLAGLRALLTLNNEHQRARLHCSVVGGAALHRLTRVVTGHGLPVVDSVPEALQIVEDVVRARRGAPSGPAQQQEPQTVAPAAWAVGLPS